MKALKIIFTVIMGFLVYALVLAPSIASSFDTEVDILPISSATRIIRITPIPQPVNNLGICGNLLEYEVTVSNKFSFQTLVTTLEENGVDISSLYPNAVITVGSCKFIQLIPSELVADENGRDSYWVIILTENSGGLSYFGMFEVSIDLMGSDVIDKID